MKRIMAVAAVALVIGGGVGVMATSHFTDVPSDHPNRADIGTVAGWGGYSGYPDGTFRPDRRITAEQMATVLGRVFPDGMTRGEFASFMVGGKARRDGIRVTDTTLAPASTTTTTAPPVQSHHYARTYWPGESCEGMWADMIYNHESWTFSDGRPEPFDPREVDYEYYLYRRLGISIGDTVIAVYDWYKRFVTETYFVCQGRAKFNNGAQSPILIYSMSDADGDSFWGVNYPLENSRTCEEALRADIDWTVDSYNRVFLYVESRDADRDRIMCEDVLPEDDTDVVGDVPAGRVAL